MKTFLGFILLGPIYWAILTGQPRKVYIVWAWTLIATVLLIGAVLTKP